MEEQETMPGSAADALTGNRTERAGGPWKRMKHHGGSMPASPLAADFMAPSRQLDAKPALSSHPSPSTARLQVILRPLPASGARSRTPSRSTTTESPLFLPTRPAQSTTPLSTHQAPSPATPMGDTGDSNSASQPRKRGRPKGWKAGMSYAELRGDPPPTRARKSARPSRATSAAAAAATPEGGSKRRGRPPKPPPLTPREQYLKSEPRYMSFGCEWHDRDPSGEPIRCPAELQNMDTLRQHVFLIHGDADTLVCRWGKCGHAPPMVFTGEEPFREHVEKAHFRSYVWHMGDGIQNKGISSLKQDADRLPPYLFDRNGNLVTPSVQDQLPEDTKGMIERKRKLREIQRLAQENAPDESEFALPPLE